MFLAQVVHVFLPHTYYRYGKIQALHSCKVGQVEETNEVLHVFIGHDVTNTMSDVRY